MASQQLKLKASRASSDEAIFPIGIVRPAAFPATLRGHTGSRRRTVI